MPYPKTISFLSKKTVGIFLLLFCCVGNISPKEFQQDNDMPAVKLYTKDETEWIGWNNLSKIKTEGRHWVFAKNNTDAPLLDVTAEKDTWTVSIFKDTKKEEAQSFSSTYVIPKKCVTEGLTLFVIEGDKKKLGYKKGSSFTSKLPMKDISPEDIVEYFPSFVELTASATSKKKTALLHVQSDQNGDTWIESNITFDSNSADTSFKLRAHEKHLFHKRKIVIGKVGVLEEDGSFKLDQNATQFSAEDLRKGMTFVQKNGKLSWHSEIRPFEELEDPEEIASTPLNLSVLSGSNQKKTSFHIQKDYNDAIWIRSNQSLKSERNEKTLLHLSHSKQFFGKQEIIIDELGTLQEDGSFKLDPKISEIQFSAEDLRKGMTFTLKNGKFTWYPEIIPFEELEDTSELTKEATYFYALSNNKTTLACTSIGLTITAILAHVLSGRNYLAQTDTWSSWSPGGLNALALRSLPQRLLLEKLYKEIAYCYGSSPDQITEFLEDIEQEIHQLNLCYWSYGILHGLYLLPKIKKFEDIVQRIYLLEMFADTIQRELANKTIQYLVKQSCTAAS